MWSFEGTSFWLVNMNAEIAIIDDQVAYTTEFNAFFDGSNQFKCILTASSSQELWSKFETNDVSNLRFLLVDILLIEESGLDIVAKIHRCYPTIEIIMLSVVEDADALIKAFGSGASGYLVKPHSFEEIANYLIIAMNGGAALSPDMARKLIGYFRPREVERGKMGPRTLQVLHFLAEGWSYKMIAHNMGITVDGVRFHIKEIYRSMNVQSKPQAVRKYLDGDY
jgi:DNA-binding NarL/FixJ family response regulator